MNCRSTFVDKDVTTEAQKILSCVKRAKDLLGYSVGMALIVRTLIGSRDKRIVELGLDGLSTYGIMKSEGKQLTNDIVNHLRTVGYISKNTAYGSLVLTDKSNDVLFGDVHVVMKCKVDQPDSTVEKIKKKQKYTKAYLFGRWAIRTSSRVAYGICKRAKGPGVYCLFQCYACRYGRE